MKAALLIASLLTMVASASVAEERTVVLSVANMTCALCPIIVKQSLEHVSGVKSVDVSLPERTAVVRFDDEAASVDLLTRATGEAGYPSVLQEEQAS